MNTRSNAGLDRSNTKDKRKVAVSLILATVGRTSELDRLFNSLAAQTMHDFEVVVVDQNPDARLQPHLLRAASLGLLIKYLQHQPANLAAARNAGIDVAAGEWLGFPDDDCWYDCQALEKVMGKGSRNPRHPAKHEGVIGRWVEQPPSGPAASRLSWQRSRQFRDVPVSSITLFLRRSLIERIGGFDSRLGVGQWFGAAEETDLVLRALRHGATVIHEPGVQVHHAFSLAAPAADSAARQAARGRARGTGALYAKHGLPLWVIVRGLCAPLVVPLLKGALFRGAFGTELAYGWSVTRGRLDGLLGWDRRQF